MDTRVCTMLTASIYIFLYTSTLGTALKNDPSFLTNNENNGDEASSGLQGADGRVLRAYPFILHQQAEDKSKEAKVESLFGSDLNGYQGSGYSEVETSIGWEGIEVPTSGIYQLRFRYATSEGVEEAENAESRVCNLFVNDVFIRSVIFENTGNEWKIKDLKDVPLENGENEIRISTISEGKGPFVDWFQIIGPLVDSSRAKEEEPARSAISTRDDGENSKTMFRGGVAQPGITYRPGDLTVNENGLMLSAGLKSRIIAKSGENVQTVNGLRPKFHLYPDGADVFLHQNGKNFAYVSNSEVRDKQAGGVGTIIFNEHGEVTDYKMILKKTKANCSGGRTPWNTWISCEEHERGQIYEVEPFGARIFNNMTYQKTSLHEKDRNEYESVTVDNRNTSRPIFYYTVDSSSGQLTRFIPDESVMKDAEASGDYSRVLTAKGKIRFLKMDPDETKERVGTYRWTSDLDDGQKSASRNFRNCEGIEFDPHEGLLYFTCKRDKQLFIIDIDGNTYTEKSTANEFKGRPDQLRLMCYEGDTGLLYFAEEGGTKGIHAMYPNGDFVQIVNGRNYTADESSGIAFSPDGRHLYYSVQVKGYIFDIWREDGYPFSSQHLPLLETFGAHLHGMGEPVSPYIKTPTERSRR